MGILFTGNELIKSYENLLNILLKKKIITKKEVRKIVKPFNIKVK